MPTTRGLPPRPAEVVPTRVVVGGAEPLPTGPDSRLPDVLAVPVRPESGDARRTAESGTDTDRPSARVGPGAADVAELTGVDPAAAAQRERATGRAGEVVAAGGRGATSVLLVGVGDGSPGALRTAGAALARRCRGRAGLVTSVAAEADDAGLQAYVEGLVLGGYAYAGARSSDLEPRRRPVSEVVLGGVAPERAEVVERALVLARATWRARDLGNEPASTKDPAWFADRAVELGRAGACAVRVLDERALADAGFDGILAVGQGSTRPPRLVELSYRPPGRAGRRARHVVLVGKGITFDTGGLTLKTSEAMPPMKVDMGGAAAVLAALAGLRDLGCALRVTGLLALAENMPGSGATRPGDVIRQYDGTTVEVLNPDAEGRLVMADAIGYAVAELAADAVVDVATLTGAVSVAFGKRLAAVLSPDDALVAALRAAGEEAGEPLWRLPLVEDYRSALDSPVADLANIATRTVGAGTITAGLFLQHFARGVRWAHLDVSGGAKSEAEVAEVGKGATGWGARTLLTWLSGPDPLA